MKVEIRKRHPVFNHEYEIISTLGDGNTSKVYLLKSIKEPEKEYALKLISNEYLTRHEDAFDSVKQEIKILQSIKHEHVIKCIGYGSNGVIKKPSGRIVDNLIYILLEYVSGGLLFDLCQNLGGSDEDSGRFFMK